MGDDDKEDDEDLTASLGEAQRMPRHLLDSKGILQFFGFLFSQPQIDTAFNEECSCLPPPIPGP